MSTTEHTAQSKPLPCPFCGKPAQRVNEFRKDRGEYHCNEHTRLMGLKKWNTRHPISTESQP